MRFRAGPALLWLLHTQLEEFPHEYAREGEAAFPGGGGVYAKLAALDGDRGGTVEITERERRELRSLLDSIVGPYGWDSITAAERRCGRAAMRRLTDHRAADPGRCESCGGWLGDRDECLNRCELP